MRLMRAAYVFRYGTARDAVKDRSDQPDRSVRSVEMACPDTTSLCVSGVSTSDLAIFNSVTLMTLTSFIAMVPDRKAGSAFPACSSARRPARFLSTNGYRRSDFQANVSCSRTKSRKALAS